MYSLQFHILLFLWAIAGTVGGRTVGWGMVTVSAAPIIHTWYPEQEKTYF
jgi:hypothetical protein